MKLDRKLRMGLIGGGPGAFIGEVHRKASHLDGEIELVAGAFDIDPKKSKEMGKHLALDPNRIYHGYQEMIEAESALPAEQRIDFVAVTTPNNWHFPISRDFLKAGFQVMCEKPMTLDLKEVKGLQKLVEKEGLVFGLMHNYTGYPRVQLARGVVRKGDLGNIRKIVLQYPQGWLATALEKTGQMQASWRTDPKQSGAGGCVGDIGTHAANLAEYASRLKTTHAGPGLPSFTPGCPADYSVSIAPPDYAERMHPCVFAQPPIAGWADESPAPADSAIFLRGRHVWQFLELGVVNLRRTLLECTTCASALLKTADNLLSSTIANCAGSARMLHALAARQVC